MEEQLNELGSSGWELVSSIPLVEGASDQDGGSVGVVDIKFVFKREV